MIINQNFKYTHKNGKITIGDVVKCKCDQCNAEFFIGIKSLQKQLLKTNTNNTYCFSCRCKQTVKNKPQCSSNYWTKEKCLDIGQKIKNSEKYQKAKKLFSEKRTGEKNGMYGKKLSIESRKKMSISRTGKIGENATAWKGGKFSLIRTIKGYLYRSINWYYKIYQRDNFRCVICGSTSKIEAHHIKPLSMIVKLLVSKYNLLKKDKTIQYQILINCEDVIDVNLENGITLCRKCHQHIHKNWGSHYCKVLSVKELKEDYEKNKEQW